MSKISYCSLEEAWGTNLDNNLKNNNHRKNTIKKTINTHTNENDQFNDKRVPNEDNNEELNAYRGKSQNDYEILKKDNDKMKKMIEKMNYVERNKVPENNINEDYNDYRFNSVNKVNGLYQDEKNYGPFQDNLEKKYLQDKIIHLENEFRKYKLFLNNKFENNNENTIEGFENKEDNRSPTDIMDLIVLIVIGLILIFIMDSLFKIGKYIGSKNNA